MMNDDINPGQALTLALRSELDSQIMLKTLQDKIANKTLRYQYEALFAEKQRHMELLRSQINNRFQTEGETGSDPPSRLGSQLPTEQVLVEMDVLPLLEQIAKNNQLAIDLYEDLASRISDIQTKELFHLLSEVEFSHKNKILTDIYLIKHHSDYLGVDITHR